MVYKHVLWDAHVSSGTSNGTDAQRRKPCLNNFRSHQHCDSTTYAQVQPVLGLIESDRHDGYFTHLQS